MMAMPTAMLRFRPVFAAAICLAAPVFSQDSEGVEYFENRVRPLLAEHCTRCHGDAKQKSSLRLDLHGAILAGGDRGAAVVPGDPAASLLLEAVLYVDEDLQMPPKSRLAQADIDTLRDWIQRGAPGPDEPLPAAGETPPAAAGAFDLEARRAAHWCWSPLAPAAPPRVAAAAWPLDPLDRFVLARLEAAGLVPAADADRASWLRRVSFDLVGLPPDPDELAAFLADAAPGAHARVVDRLLASPQFGVRWARHWLDLVRYAETKGHEFDFAIANAWEYRDYVVRAFNADVPYAQFVTEHLAGDLLDAPRVDPATGANESVLGTGFWFLGEEVHSPVDPRLDETERAANKLDVMSKTFLGLSVGCARCHDHKFDAIATTDFYALAGYVHSAHYRQARFETSEHNRAVAEKIAALDVSAASEVRRWLAATPAGATAELAATIRTAQALVQEAPASSSAAAEVGGELPEWAGFVLADFEAGDWAGWVVDGDAFGPAPLRRAGAPGHLSNVGARGAALVNSRSVGVGGQAEGSDAHVGTLTSPEFRLERDYLHFLIGGGNHPERTCVNLLVDGEVVASATGRNDSAMQPQVFDLRPWKGRPARVQAVDRESGGWGHVSFDHLVLSDLAGPAALDETRDRATAAAWHAHVAAAAGTHDVRRVEAWASALELARNDPADTLHPLAVGRVPAADAGPAALELPPGAQVRADWSRAGATPWRVDGPAFGTGPRDAGSLLFDAAGAPWRMAVHGAAWAEPAFADLRIDPRSQAEPSRIEWNQAGRTLYSPTFTLQNGKVWYLVQGSGHAYASVASYRLVQGPLHHVVLRSWDAGEGFRWVGQDLSAYAGQRVHLEFTPKDPRALGAGESEAFAVAMLVESEDRPPDPPDFAAHLRAQLAASVQPDGDLASSFAAALRAAFAGPVRAPDRPDRTALADWALQHTGLAFGFDAWPQASLAAGRAELAARVRAVSRTAPALVDGTGVDEFLLARGSHKSPQQPVARRNLLALGGIPGEAAAEGSGRLELARRITDPATALPARVLVNRLWQHLFGRGIVASVDDFGVMGELPSHPELLDHLAARFLAGGGSIKSMLRTLVLSRTYRMGAVAAPATAARADLVDPDDRLLHRMPVRRLEGEAIRDALLAVSGRLDPALGGAPVPVHLTPFMDGRGRPGKSGPVDGDGRRSLYLEVRRNFLIPFFLAFDFPQPATTMGRRGSSNVPAQALALLNDPLVTAQADLWAGHLLAESDPDARLDRMYLEAFSRAPRDAEREQARAWLAARGQQAGCTDAERAAWSELALVLFNLKEFVFLN